MPTPTPPTRASTLMPPGPGNPRHRIPGASTPAPPGAVNLSTSQRLAARRRRRRRRRSDVGQSPMPQPRPPTGATMPGSPESTAAASVRASMAMSKSHPVVAEATGRRHGPASRRPRAARRGSSIAARRSPSRSPAARCSSLRGGSKDDGAAPATPGRRGAGRRAGRAAARRWRRAAAAPAAGSRPRLRRRRPSRRPPTAEVKPPRPAAEAHAATASAKHESKGEGKKGRASRTDMAGRRRPSPRPAKPRRGRRARARLRAMTKMTQMRTQNRSYRRRRGAGGRIGLGVAARPARAGDSAEAEALIRQGVELRAQKKDERALPLFEKAYQVSRSPRTAGQLGLVEMALGYFVDAEKYLGEAVASPDHPWVAKNLADAEGAARDREVADRRALHHRRARRRRGARERQGRSASCRCRRRSASTRGAPTSRCARPATSRRRTRVTMVGGKREDRSYRLQREAVAVAPPPPPPAHAGPPREMPKPVGGHAAGAGGRRRDPAARAGAAGRPAAPAASITATPAPSGGGDHSNLRPVAWGVGIAAGAALVFGAVEGIVAIKKRNEFNNHLGPIPTTRSTRPPRSSTATCRRRPPPARTSRTPGRSARTLSIVGFVGGRRAGRRRRRAVGAVVAQGACRVRPRLSRARPMSGRAVLLVGCSSRRSRAMRRSRSVPSWCALACWTALRGRVRRVAARCRSRSATRGRRAARQRGRAGRGGGGGWRHWRGSVGGSGGGTGGSAIIADGGGADVPACMPGGACVPANACHKGHVRLQRRRGDVLHGADRPAGERDRLRHRTRSATTAAATAAWPAWPAT